MAAIDGVCVYGRTLGGASILGTLTPTQYLRRRRFRLRGLQFPERESSSFPDSDSLSEVSS